MVASSSLISENVDMGPGYRVYFGHQAQRFVVLLCAGDKKSQQSDIRTAIRY